MARGIVPQPGADRALDIATGTIARDFPADPLLLPQEVMMIVARAA